MIPTNICIMCKHYSGKDRCRAFPDGIPRIIRMGRHDHNQPYPGDNGIRFEPMEKRNQGAANVAYSGG